jgi:hypothetical protein
MHFVACGGDKFFFGGKFFFERKKKARSASDRLTISYVPHL